MFNPDPRHPRLSESESRRLAELERQMRVEDPVLEHSLRSGRIQIGTLDPVVASLVAVVATPLITLALFLGGPWAGVAAAAVSVGVLVVLVLRSRGDERPRPSAYR